MELTPINAEPELVPKDLTTSNNSIQQLLDSTQMISHQLSQFLSTTVQINPQEDLVTQLSSVFRHQQQINQLQYSVSTANYMANIANFTRTKKLEGIILRGQQEIITLSKTITNLRATIQNLDMDVEAQRQEAQRLNSVLKDTQNVLNNAIIQYRKELDEQKRVLDSTAEKLDKLSQTRIKTDFLVDSGILFGCILLLRNSLTMTAVDSLSSFLPKKNRKYVERLIQLVTFIALFIRLRKFLLALGIHGGVGTVFSYLKAVTGLDIGKSIGNVNEFMKLPPRDFDRKLLK
ncbi:hypothetical protein HDV04_002701 [Boothiomyces sp. JEL0838]|nr:hypothetical protein HDV04_002701 [Boothiomyces sp. JEL0838]